MHHRLLERSSCRLPLATCCADGAAPYPIHTVFWESCLGSSREQHPTGLPCQQSRLGQ
jgi:hypothetical protein